MSTIEQAIQTASKCLGDVGLENPRMESEFLVAALLGIPRGHLILNRHQTIPTAKLQGLQAWLGQRQKRKPLAYVTGEQPFRDLNLSVTSDVLIPRPETELLVEQAMRLLDRMADRAVVMDVGTGSGNIAISLAVHPKVRQVVAIDLSAEALKVARRNGKQHQGLPIDWFHGNLLEPALKRGLQAQLIVANLPYVRTGDLAGLEPELHWEPRMALDGGADGLRLIEPCIGQAAQALFAEGMLLLEIGADQSQEVSEILRGAGTWDNIQVFMDLAGLPRLVQAKRRGY